MMPIKHDAPIYLSNELNIILLYNFKLLIIYMAHNANNDKRDMTPVLVAICKYKLCGLSTTVFGSVKAFALANKSSWGNTIGLSAGPVSAII